MKKIPPAPLDNTKLAYKASALAELRRTEPCVYVHVDTRIKGVKLPPELLGRPQVILAVAAVVADVRCGDAGWGATLTANGRQYMAIIPWPAVFFIVGESGLGAQWPSDTPHGVFIQHVGGKPRSFETVEVPPAPKRTLPAGWRVIDGGA